MASSRAARSLARAPQPVPLLPRAGGVVAGGAAAAGLVAGPAGGAVTGLAAASARAASGAAGAYRLGAFGKTGSASVASGLGGVGKAALGAATSPQRKATEAINSGHQGGAVLSSGGGADPSQGVRLDSATCSQTHHSPSSSSRFFGGRHERVGQNDDHRTCQRFDTLP